MIKLLLTFSLLSAPFLKTGEEKVYVCNNKTSEVYHTNRQCKALHKCSHEIIDITKSDAINKYGKRACKVC